MTTLREQRVALIGLGNMGLPIARAMRESHVDLRVFDVSTEARERALAAGLSVAQTVGEVMSDAVTVVLVLPTSAIVETVVSQMSSHGVRGCTIIDMSSSNPRDTVRIAQQVLERGGAYLDAPVSGGVLRAEQRTLAVMVGGEASVVDRARTLLSCVGTPRHVGPLGSGHAMKALNNLVSAAHLAATSRAVLAAERWGIPRDTAVDVLNGSSGQSVSSSVKWPNYVLTKRFDAGFAATLMEKDVRIAASALEHSGQDDTLAHAVLDEWAAAAAWLGPGADHTAIVRWMEEGSPRGISAPT